MPQGSALAVEPSHRATNTTAQENRTSNIQHRTSNIERSLRDTVCGTGLIALLTGHLLEFFLAHQLVHFLGKIETLDVRSVVLVDALIISETQPRLHQGDIGARAIAHPDLLQRL